MCPTGTSPLSRSGHTSAVPARRNYSSDRSSGICTRTRADTRTCTRRSGCARTRGRARRRRGICRLPARPRGATGRTRVRSARRRRSAVAADDPTPTETSATPAGVGACRRHAPPAPRRACALRDRGAPAYRRLGCGPSPFRCATGCFDATSTRCRPNDACCSRAFSNARCARNLLERPQQKPALCTQRSIHEAVRILRRCYSRSPWVREHYAPA